MKKTLYLTRHYLDDNNGGANASKAFILLFSSLFGSMTLMYPEHSDRSSADRVPQGVTPIPVYDTRSRLRKGIDVYRGILHRFTHAVKEHLASHAYDVIVVDHTLAYAGIADSIEQSGAKIVTIHHNVERDYNRANKPSVLYRLPYMHFTDKAEIQALLASDVNLTLTSKDAAQFQSWYKNRQLHLHPVGLCEYHDIEEKTLPKTPFGNVFAITGSLCFKQSVEPVIAFVRDYYPLLCKHFEHCRLLIAGRNPNEELQAICSSHPQIELIANPVDINEIIEQADVYLCPINVGSGIKLRVLDGLRNGRPVVCHNVSAVGYERMIEEGAMFSYGDQDSFEECLLRLKAADFDPTAIYETYRDEFSPAAALKRLKRILMDECII